MAIIFLSVLHLRNFFSLLINQVDIISRCLATSLRGNAVVRPAAKKYLRQEAESSFSVDISADVKSGETCSGKSRAGRAVQRLVRVFRLLSIIATVNVPLYIMLLFKDWI